MGKAAGATLCAFYRSGGNIWGENVSLSALGECGPETKVRSHENTSGLWHEKPLLGVQTRKTFIQVSSATGKSWKRKDAHSRRTGATARADARVTQGEAYVTTLNGK